MKLSNLYNTKFAAAYVRGMVMQTNNRLSQPALSQKSLNELSASELESILQEGKAGGCKLYHFKSAHGDMPRVKRVLGFLQSIQMESLLDVGSGRGVFLWPFMHAFPQVQVLSVDLLAHRVGLLQAVRLGGMANLTAITGDICDVPVGDKTYDVVTLLEVLEHISDVAAAVRSAVRIAKKFVIVTVPSKSDNNPEHIHLLTKEALIDLFTQAGCARLHFDGVPGHLMMVAVMEGTL